MLSEIRRKCGIADGVDVYDSDIVELVNDALYDMKTAGVPADILPNQITSEDTTTEGLDPRVLTTVVLFVKAHLGDDRSDTDQYLRLYHERVFKLSILTAEKDAPINTTDTTTTTST